MCVRRCPTNLLSPPEAFIAAKLTIFHYTSMAPPHVTVSKAAFRSKTGGKPLVGRINKNQVRAKMFTPTFAHCPSVYPKPSATDDPVDQVMVDAPETAIADVNKVPGVENQNKQHPIEAALTNLINVESLITNLTRLNLTTELSPLTRKYPFKLTEAIPKAGFRFQSQGKGKRSIMGNWKSEGRVSRALCADMGTVDKDHAEKLIIPVFNQAYAMMCEGYMAALRPPVGLEGEETGLQDLEETELGEFDETALEELEENTREKRELTLEELEGMWKRFMGKLWVDSRMKWAQKLTQKQFSKFIGTLADARWQSVYGPNSGDDSLDCWLVLSPCSWMLRLRRVSIGPWVEMFSATRGMRSKRTTCEHHSIYLDTL